MKRDLDLLREILLSIEEFEPQSVSAVQSISFKDFSGTEPQNLYHINMLIEVNFIDLVGKATLSGDFPIRGITMLGHDFLDAVREPTVWARTKGRLKDMGGWTLEIALAVAKEELKRQLVQGFPGGQL
ncbi:MAG: DUF2513 domain-containing protein [Rhizobiaceae bacterium]